MPNQTQAQSEQRKLMEQNAELEKEKQVLLEHEKGCVYVNILYTCTQWSIDTYIWFLRAGRENQKAAETVWTHETRA